MASVFDRDLPQCLRAIKTFSGDSGVIRNAVDLCLNIFPESPKNSRYWECHVDEQVHRAQLDFQPVPGCQARLIFGRDCALGYVVGKNNQSEIREVLDYTEWSDFEGWLSLLKTEYPVTPNTCWVHRYKATRGCTLSDGPQVASFEQNCLVELVWAGSSRNPYVRGFPDGHWVRAPEAVSDPSWVLCSTLRMKRSLLSGDLTPFDLDFTVLPAWKKPKRYLVERTLTIVPKRGVEDRRWLDAGTIIEVHPTGKACRLVEDAKEPEEVRAELDHPSWILLDLPFLPSNLQQGILQYEERGFLAPR